MTMESPGSEISSDSTDSSSADSSSADSSPVQTGPIIGNNQVPAVMDTTTVIDNDDSASDISMSADTDDEDEGLANTSTTQVNPVIQALLQSTTEAGVESSKKRKYPGSIEASNGQIKNGIAHEDRKRLKPDDNIQKFRTSEGTLPMDKSLLPAEIWHHIFTFCSPKCLGLLLRVNRSFNAHLDSSSSGRSIDPLSISAAQILMPDTIWRASRRLYQLPGLPVPILGKSELAMWRLACGSLCQFCNKKKQNISTIPMDQWHSGPGENGVSPIWAFGIRTCGPCLQNHSAKEIDLLLSSSIPSPLLAALPFVFFTNELHVISPATLQSGQHPSGIQITKHFSNTQVEEIKQEFEDVKTMGSATAEEWLKGLEGRGKERRNDAARWERWEAGGGIVRMQTLGNYNITTATTVPSGITTPTMNSNIGMYQRPNSLHQSTPFSTTQTQQLPLPLQTSFPNPPPRFDSPSQNGSGTYPPRPYQQAKHERTKEEVAELKAARRAEIERQCMLLSPPITAGVLAHMASFQAAIQIIQPLDDGAWEVLKPRLLSQRGEAEQRENDRLAQTRVVQERFDERRFQDMQAKSDPKDLFDREWDDIQAPLRARIGGYADEIIRDGWNGGGKVSYETSPLFAAEVLMYVRKRFYAEVAKDEAAVRATGREPEMDPPNGPYTRRLILENMKWVFDTKIKPHTEPYRKELFLCNDCEYAAKYYGFEGVIQHYAAKHTSALSVGSVVVHWKSEWPEYPPFNPEPNNVKPWNPAGPSTGAPPYASSGPSLPAVYGYGGYQSAPVSAPMQTPNLHVYQESPGPYYGHPQFGDQYSGQQNGPYAPPQAYPDTSQGYQAPQYSMAPTPAHVTGYNDPSQDYSQQNFSGQYQPANQGIYASPNPGPQYPTPASEVPIQQPPYVPATGQYGLPYSQPPSYAPTPSYQASNLTQTPERTEEYVAQLQDVARNARDIWNSIGGLKETPGSVKVYTIIYHLLKRFRASFQEELPLSMVVDGLHSNKDMRPVRNVNGLVCKACSLGMAGSTSALQKKHFSFPQLVNHFHKVHEEGISLNGFDHIPDWTKDMVELPDSSKLAAVANAPGLDDHKLQLLVEALPEIVSPQVPNIDELPEGPSRDYGDIADQNGYGNLAPSQDNHEKYYATVDSGRPSESGSVTYDSGEYDPRNPFDLPVDPRPSHKASRRNRQAQEPENRGETQPLHRQPRHDGPQQDFYDDRPERTYVEPRPKSPSFQTRPIGEYGRVVVREDPPVYMDRVVRYREPDDVEYRVRRNSHVYAYEEPAPGRDYRLANSQSYHSNRQDLVPVVMHESSTRDSRLPPVEDAAAQQSRIFEVVAKISQQAQQARARQPVQPEPVENGSEDGEVRAEPALRPESRVAQDEASSAAERFLNEFVPGEPTENTKKTEEVERKIDETRAQWETERIESTRYQPPMESQRRMRDVYEEDNRVFSSGRLVNPVVDDRAHNGYFVHERVAAPRPVRTYAYEDRYAGPIPEQAIQRERSPELVDRRYKLNNVVYRDERQGSHGTHHTPSRYARYESVRLENDRARSRSPVYVKMGPQPGQYRERSPAAHPLHQEPVYRTRTPPSAVEEIAYERAPRQEYYRVYADEPRPREPQYTEAFEFVRVADPQGEYMIRRPVRREREPIYATYHQDDHYARQPIYETRAPVSRPDPAFYEEYDPRHPEPAPAPVRQQVRYE